MEGLAREHGWRRGIELGLGNGFLFSRFLALGIEMVGVDLGARPDRVARVKTLAAGKPHTIYWHSTADAARFVPDGWADFCFVDAGHGYHAVASDIALWQPKVRAGGWFGGHDYNETYSGVVRAVHEAFGDRIVLLPNYIWARA